MIKFLVTFLISSLIPAMTHAVTVNDLYQIDVPVATQSPDLREQAVRDGFLQVLVRLTGNPKINENPLIKETLSKADYYVREYSYSSATMDSAQYMLQVHYEKADMDRLLKKANAAHIGTHRPLILVWLIQVTPHGPEIIDDDTAETILSALKEQGKKYGLAYIFPVMDTTDMQQVSAADIAEMALPNLKKASQRYSPNALLIGKLTKSDKTWQGEWELILGEEQLGWNLKDKTPSALLDTVSNQVSQALAKNYAADGGDESEFWLKLEVSNISQRDELTELTQYLNQLAPVKKVTLNQVKGDTATLSVLVKGTLNSFQQNVAIGQHMVLKSENTVENTLFYDWVE